MADENTTPETPSMFPLILTDWYNAGATVTLTVRSGAQFTGVIAKRPSETYDHVALRAEGRYDGISRKEVRHDVVLADVTAITAVAR